MKYVIFFFGLFYTVRGFAYPELSRHGYVNCTTCHVSPAGGGILTPYGRELSKEILSSWAKDGEQYFAYDAYKKLGQSEKVLLSAFFRGVQVVRDSDAKRDARAIIMQADAEAAYNGEKFAVVGTLGRQELRSGFLSHGRLFSRRHYALYRLAETHNLRFGRFLKFYGLNDANHNLMIRRDLQLGFDTESYNLEYSWLGESVSAYLTGIFGSFGDTLAQSQEKGATGSISYYFLDKQKVGLSFMRSEDTTQRRTLGGPWLIFSFIKPLFLLSEFDYQNKTIKLTSQRQVGFVNSNRLNYEWFQGFISFLTFEKKFLNHNDPLSRQQSYGAGLQFFPRPHIELVAAWQKDQVLQTNTSSDLYWLMLHFYL